MDWSLLEHDEFVSIATSINYDRRKIKAGELYKRLRQLQHPLESKVKFILQHWGWDGAPRKDSIYIISAIHEIGFSIPKSVKIFYEQLYGLTFPAKEHKTATDLEIDYGGALKFKFAERGNLLLWDWLLGAEWLSDRFEDDIMPIGYRINYNGFSQNQHNGWEDPDYCSCGAWGYELYLGNSGKVYIWDSEMSDYLGIAAENLVSFFASAFGLIYNVEKSCGDISERDIELMDQIDSLMRQGRYKQHCFKKEAY